MKHTMNQHQIFNSDIYQTFLEQISCQEYIETDNHIQPSNSILDFLPMDTEELWLENQKIQDDTNTINYYLTNPIQYRLNNHGYRTDYQFKKGDEVNIFLGCSHTMGIGLHIEDTWSYLLNKQIGGKFANLAVGGCGIETQFRHLIKWIGYFKVNNIFHYQPMYAREELLYEDRHLGFLNTHFPDELKPVSDYFKYSLISEPHIFRKYLTNIMAIENIANKIGAKYYFNHSSPNSPESPNNIQARDFAHYSIEQNHEICNIFLERIGTNDTSIPISDKFLNII